MKVTKENLIKEILEVQKRNIMTKTWLKQFDIEALEQILLDEQLEEFQNRKELETIEK